MRRTIILEQALGYVVLFFVVLLFPTVLYHVTAHLGDQREAERLRRIAEAPKNGSEEAKQARVAAGLWLNLKKIFPYVPTPKIKNPTASRILDGILGALMRFPEIGVVTHSPLPVPLPPANERKRHLYVVGKTGSGKSTFLEHLIQIDMEAGHGVCVMAPEGEFFRRRLLPMVPESRIPDLIYFAPGNPDCPITLNPLAVGEGEEPMRAAEDLFTILKRAFETHEMGVRMAPILQNAVAALVGYPGATLWDVRRMLSDRGFRREVVENVKDEYVSAFWRETFPRYPKDADLPIVNRLDRFLRSAPVRRALCNPESSFSIRDVLGKGKILFIDLFGLSEEDRKLIGQIVLSKVQLELMRRELIRGSFRPFFLYADEFQSFAGVSENLWRELLSRGRKYGLSLTLANQYPAQLPKGLQDEIFGNVNSLVSFALGTRDAQIVRRELLIGMDGEVEPVAMGELLELPVGRAYAKLAGGHAIPLTALPPLTVGERDVERVIRESWERYGTAPVTSGERGVGERDLREPECFLE